MVAQETMLEVPCSVQRAKAAGLVLQEATVKQVAAAQVASVAEDLIASSLILLLQMSQRAGSKTSIKLLLVEQDKYNKPEHVWQGCNSPCVSHESWPWPTRAPASP
jgi:hypothetical protein